MGKRLSNQNRSRRTRRGFTLLELVVALVVLGILAALAVPTYTTVIGNAHTGVANATALSVADDAVAMGAEHQSPATPAYMSAAAAETNGKVSVVSSVDSSGTLTTTFSVSGSADTSCVITQDTVDAAPSICGGSDLSDYSATTTTAGPDLLAYSSFTASQVAGDLGNNAMANAAACTTAGVCYVGGGYEDLNGITQAFIASDSGGTWSDTQIATGISSDTDPGAMVTSLWCGSTCVAGGYYTSDSVGGQQAFVASNATGSWVVTALNAGAGTEVSSISCDTALVCVAGGYTQIAGTAFDATNASGSWVTTQALTSLTYPQINSVWCNTSGVCEEGGDYWNSGNQEAFMASNSTGSWVATPVAGSLNQPFLNSVSCTSSNVCVAGGNYFEGPGEQGSFVITGSGSTWTISDPFASLDSGGDLNNVQVVSCGTSSCEVAGEYMADGWNQQAVVASNASGSWVATELAGSLNTGNNAGVTGLSCTANLTCVATGQYAGSGSGGFYASNASGSWSTSQVGANLGATQGPVQPTTAACDANGACVLIGWYYTGSDAAFAATGSL